MAAAGSRVPLRRLGASPCDGLEETRACEKYFNCALLCLTARLAIFDKNTKTKRIIRSMCQFDAAGGISGDTPDDAIAGWEPTGNQMAHSTNIQGHFPGKSLIEGCRSSCQSWNTWESKPQSGHNIIPKDILSGLEANWSHHVMLLLDNQPRLSPPYSTGFRSSTSDHPSNALSGQVPSDFRAASQRIAAFLADRKSQIKSKPSHDPQAMTKDFN